MNEEGDAWSELLLELSRISDVTPVVGGFLLRLLATGQEIVLRAEQDDWSAYVSIMWGEGAEAEAGARRELLAALLNASPTTRALTVTRDYQLLLSPYVP